MDVQVGDEWLLLGQKKCINELFLKVGLTISSPLPTHMSSNYLSKVNDSQSSSSYVDSTLYRITINALQHVFITWPDINFPVNKLSQFMQHPLLCHWKVVLWVLRYLKGTINHSLLFRFTLVSSSEVTLISFVDDDRGSDALDRKISVRSLLVT